MAENKDGFTYIYSEELGQKIAISDKTGKVYCQDKTVYSLDEVRLLEKAGGITKGVHLVKKIFSGSVVAAEPITKETSWKKEALENTSKQEQHSSAGSTPQQTQRSDERFLDWQGSVIF